MFDVDKFKQCGGTCLYARRRNYKLESSLYYYETPRMYVYDFNKAHMHRH